MKEIELLGVRMTALTMEELNGSVQEAITHGSKTIIPNHNLHSIYLYHGNEHMRTVYSDAEVIHIDGMPLVLLANLLGFEGVHREHRITYVDWIDPLLDAAAKSGWRVFYLGGKPGVAQRATEILTERYPNLELGNRHGYFNPEPGHPENREVLEAIRAYAPDILMVGMGMPRQEEWIAKNLEEIAACVILPSGACFDYIAGAIPTPPRWMARLGFEWLYRLVSEPRRLWKRYLWEPWFLLGYFFKDVLAVVSGGRTFFPHK